MPSHLPYPDEFVSPDVKAGHDFQLDYVRAMYYTTNRYGGRLYQDESDFDALVEFAQGRTSVEDLKRLFGYIRNNTNPLFDGPESLMYTDLRALNLGAKYVNRCVAKMVALNYEITLGATDITTVDEIKDYQSMVKAFYRLKSWMETVKIDPQEMFPDLDIGSLPKFEDEMMLQGKINPKIKKIIDAEKTIQLIHTISKMRQQLRQVSWDIAVIGRGHFHTFLNENNIPRIKRINPKYWFGSYVDNEDFSLQENAGFIDFITINQFRKEAHGHLSPREIEEVASHYSYVNSPMTPGYNARQIRHWDGLGYIPVVRYYFLSNDERTYRVQNNRFGNPSIIQVENGYEIPEGEQVGKDTRIINNRYTTVYGGTWVIDSDVLYNFGPKNYPRTNLVDLSLPIKTYAPNMREGRVVSFTSQILEPAFMANVAWNKIKEILAKGWMGVRQVDIGQLEKVSIGRGGREWSPREVYEYMNMSNTLLKRGKINQYDQSYGEAVADINAGLKLADYFSAFTTSVQIMESMTGTAIGEAFNQPDRLAVGVMEASLASGDLDMEYMYNAHDEIYEQASSQLLLLAQEAKRNKATIAHLIPALGKSTLEYWEVPDHMAYTEYGLYIKRLKSQDQMRLEFLLDVREAVKMGMITMSDSAFLRNVENLKEAREIMAQREEQNQRRQQEAMAVNQQMALQANAQAAQLKTQGKMQEQAQQGDIDKEIVILTGQINAQIAQINKTMDAQAKAFSDQIKLITKKQEGTDKLLIGAMRNRVEEKKVDKRADKSPED